MSDEISLGLDAGGFPVLLTAPKIAVRDDRHATTSVRTRVGGRAAPGQPADPHAPPADVAEGEWHRRMDAVRDAARELEPFAEQDVSDWLRGRINRPFSQAELGAFLADVRAQQLADISDVLDQMERGKERKRRVVTIRAPKGYLRRILNALDDAELRALRERLLARGWSAAQIQSGLVKRLSTKRRDVLDDAPHS